MSAYTVLFQTNNGNIFFIEAFDIFCDHCGCSCHSGVETPDGKITCRHCVTEAQTFSSNRRRLFAKKTGIKLVPKGDFRSDWTLPENYVSPHRRMKQFVGYIPKEDFLLW